jgi:intracellular sulfur oxidation DsrE/DsrF family protein
MKFLFATLFVALISTGNICAQQSLIPDSSLVNRITDSLTKTASAKYSVSIHDSITRKVKDSLKWDAIKKMSEFPLIKNSEMSFALPVPLVTDKADPSIKYKLVFNMTIWSRDSISKQKINEGLAEIGRIINLHAAAGVPKENLELAIIVHGPALNVFLKNDVYQKKFKTNNPNLDILKQFINLKTSLVACGQAELFLNIPATDMLPEVKTAYSAKVALSTYQLKGYVLFDIEEEK